MLLTLLIAENFVIFLNLFINLIIFMMFVICRNVMRKYCSLFVVMICFVVLSYFIILFLSFILSRLCSSKFSYLMLISISFNSNSFMRISFNWERAFSYDKMCLQVKIISIA